MSLIRRVILRDGLRREGVEVSVTEVAFRNEVCDPFEQGIAIDQPLRNTASSSSSVRIQ